MYIIENLGKQKLNIEDYRWPSISQALCMTSPIQRELIVNWDGARFPPSKGLHNHFRMMARANDSILWIAYYPWRRNMIEVLKLSRNYNLNWNIVIFIISFVNISGEKIYSQILECHYVERLVMVTTVLSCFSLLLMILYLSDIIWNTLYLLITVEEEI